MHNDHQLKCPQSTFVLSFFPPDFQGTGYLHLQVLKGVKCKHLQRENRSSLKVLQMATTDTVPLKLNEIF